MRHVITKEFSFSASHVLSGLEPGHPCSRLHGHNYVVTAELASDRLRNGMVVDYNDLAPFAAYVAEFDHRHLNDMIFVNPTAEHLAVMFAEQLRSCFPLFASAVTVSETPKTTARCEL